MCEGSSPASSAFAHTGQEMKQETRYMKPGMYILFTTTHETCNVKYMKCETRHISTLTFGLLTSDPWWCRGKNVGSLHWVPICEGSSPACSAFALIVQEMKQETRNMKPGLYILFTATHETCNVKYMKHVM